MEDRSPFRSLREPNVRIFFAGLALSNVGTWAQTTAVILLVRDLGGGGLELGIVTACQFLPMLLFGLYAGALADRSDRHRLTIAIQSLMGVQAVALGIVDLAGAANIPLLYALTSVYGLLAAFDNPTRRTFATELVPQESLANILSLSTSVMTGARMFGPALAALLVDRIGTGWVFILNGVSFLAFLWAMVRMDASRFHPIARAPRSTRPVRDGLREVWDDPVLRITLVVFALVSTFAYNYLVVLPLLVAERIRGDEALFGWLLSAMSVGNVVGSLLVARMVVVSQRWVYATAAALAVALGAVSFATDPLPALLLVVPLGAASTAFVNSTTMIFQQRTGPQVRSRVLALATVVFLGSTPIGGPITGAIGDAFGALWAGMYGSIIAAVALVGGLVALTRHTGSFRLPEERSTPTIGPAEATTSQRR